MRLNMFNSNSILNLSKNIHPHKLRTQNIIDQITDQMNQGIWIHNKRKLLDNIQTLNKNLIIKSKRRGRNENLPMFKVELRLNNKTGLQFTNIQRLN